MMDTAQTVILAGTVLAAGYLLTTHYASQASQASQADPGTPDASNTDPAPSDPTDTSNPTIFDDLMNQARNTLGIWRPPAKYAGLIAQAEDQNGIPRDLLARLLYQECHWREDIITGRVNSPTGAQGIAQFMPATARQYGVNPLDPASAIDGAGRYLKWLFGQFGNWSETLAAYNWGIGNVQRKGLVLAPRETRLYYTQILADVNTSNGTAYA
jgi:soluble lytic murein transglycosylase-like protein